MKTKKIKCVRCSKQSIQIYEYGEVSKNVHCDAKLGEGGAYEGYYYINDKGWVVPVNMSEHYLCPKCEKEVDNDENRIKTLFQKSKNICKKIFDSCDYIGVESNIESIVLFLIYAEWHIKKGNYLQGLNCLFEVGEHYGYLLTKYREKRYGDGYEHYTEELGSSMGEINLEINRCLRKIAGNLKRMVKA